MCLFSALESIWAEETHHYEAYLPTQHSLDELQVLSDRSVLWQNGWAALSVGKLLVQLVSLPFSDEHFIHSHSQEDKVHLNRWMKVITRFYNMHMLHDMHIPHAICTYYTTCTWNMECTCYMTCTCNMTWTCYTSCTWYMSYTCYTQHSHINMARTHYMKFTYSWHAHVLLHTHVTWHHMLHATWLHVPWYVHVVLVTTHEVK